MTCVQILVLSKPRYIPERNNHTESYTQMLIAVLFVKK